MIKDFVTEIHDYRASAEKAIAQVPDTALNHVPGTDMNYVAMLVRHMSGSCRSRFPDFLTTDGENPWRDLDSEFVERQYSHDAVITMCTEGWLILENTL